MHGAIDWIRSETGQEVTDTRPLRGGLTSDVRAVTLANGERLVLRRYVRGGKAAAPQVENEGAVLRRLAAARIPAPRLVAVRPSGADPMILMTRVPGRVWLSARDHDGWLRQMARALPPVHAVPITTAAPDPRSHVVEDLSVPAWTSRPGLWRSARSLLARPPAHYVPTFTHSDYQHFNIIWSGKRLSGVVDWVYAGPDHPDADAAHCRLNLAILFSIESAERFRECFEAEAGRPMDPWWDLRGMTSFGPDWSEFIPVQVAGRARFDARGAADRVEGLMERILGRF